MEYSSQDNDAMKTVSERSNTLLVNRAVVFDDDRFLLLQRSYEDSYNPGLWEFPGGKVDGGEDSLDGLKREVLEETGLKIEPQAGPAHVESQMIRGGKHNGRLHVTLFHSAVLLGGELAISDEHENFTWDHVDSALELPLTPKSRLAIIAITNARLA